MGFNFAHVCDLLSNLEANLILKASSVSRKTNPDVTTVTNWFNRHQKKIDSGEIDRLALLSCLFPEKRPERVFGLKEPSLVKIIGRCLLLGASRKQGLDQWRRSGGGDLGQCVENVMQEAENQLGGEQKVTVEDIDAALNRIASRCRFSGKSIRQKYAAVDVDEALAPIFRRLTSRDAKWFTRMILKNYSPVILPAKLILRNVHFLLPDLLRFQDSFEAALEVLGSGPIKYFPSRADPQYANILNQLALFHLSPRVGIKIGRPEFYKARSIKHCCTMIGKRTMSLERKYDGEYCQIHIDLTRRPDCIQIFSKSGKDSTIDKQDIHKILVDCLRIGQNDCKFSDRCILEGELLVWSDTESEILGFHKLRKHISRSGSFLRTENDSPYVFNVT
jgi:DNA ligase-4